MKKSLAKKVTLSILAGAVLMSSSVVWAAAVVKPVPDGGDYNWIYSSNSEDEVVFLRNNEIGDNMSSVMEDWEEKGVNEGSLENASFFGSVLEDGSGEVSGGKVTLGEDIAVYSLVGGYACEDELLNSKGKSLSIEEGAAKSNTVNISNGTVKHSVYGGWGSTATNNNVNISGGTFSGGIVGGFALSGVATNNTVNISGTADLEDAVLCGGATYKLSSSRILRKAPSSGQILVVVGSYGGADTPNTLNIGTNSKMYKGKVKGIAGFDVIKFESIDWKKDVVGNTDNYVIKVGTLELNNTKVTVGNVRVKGDTTLTAGDDMTLIQADAMRTSNSAGANNGILTDQKVTIYKGVAQTVEADVKQSDDKKQIYLKIAGSDSVSVDEDSETNPNSGGVPGSSELNPQILVIGESRTAATAFTNQGSELIETGLNALARDNEKDTKVFAAVYGNHSEYETGSHVNVNGWSGIVGIGKTNDNGLTVGAFFENGEGNYSTHNIFTDDYIRGDGEACYNGGGFLVRKDNANGVYAEASLRAGNLQNELRNAVRNGSELTGYDIDTFYYGAHVGIGKVIPRGNDGDSIDVYGKFIYTHHDGETFDIGGTATKFDSVESERLRLGFRINEVQTNKLSMYYGAAWEYEFNGDAHDKIASFDLETPSLEGSTVIGEIGAHYKASDKWSFDLNGRAYTGQREGFSGSVQANYAF